MKEPYIIYYHTVHGQTWTWIKNDQIMDRDIRERIKRGGDSGFDALFTGKRNAWYIQKKVTQDRVQEVLGDTMECLGVVEGRQPTKLWSNCLDHLNGSRPQPKPKMQTEGGTMAWSPRHNIAKRLKDMAEKMQEEIDHLRRPMTQNPTRKRLNEFEQRCKDADYLEKLQYALYGLSNLWEIQESGPHPLLRNVRTKALIESLWQYESWPRWEDAQNRFRKAGILPENIKEAHDALRACSQPPDREAENRLRELEVEVKRLIGQIPGFYPTPDPVIDILLAALSAHPGTYDRILEPSSGAGAIALRLRDAYPGSVIHCCEVNYTLHELCERLGFEMAGRDFLDYEPVVPYDAIVMNPPFENGQPFNHILHAYEVCLRANGILASVVPSPFGDGDRTKAEQATRLWLKGITHEWRTLSTNAFRESGTGVASKVLIVYKY